MKSRGDFPSFSYPPARRGEAFDEFFGLTVPDPYRWLEDEQSPEVRAWARAQDELAQALFAKMPEYGSAKRWLRSNWINSPSSVPVFKGERKFWQARPQGADHEILWVSDAAGERKIFDLNESGLSDARLAAIGGPSPQGRYYVYGISRAGHDVCTLHVHDVDQGRDLSEVLAPSLMMFTSQGWLPDESGFFYSYLPWDALLGKEVDRVPGLYLHRVNTAFDQDSLIARHDLKSRKIMIGIPSKELGRLLVHKMHLMGGRGGWGLLPLDIDGQGRIDWLIDEDIGYRFSFVGTTDSDIIWVTDHQAPNWRVVALDAGDLGLNRLRTLIAEKQEPISMFGGHNIDAVTLHEERLYVNYIHHNENQLRVFDLKGQQETQVPLPPLTTMTGISFEEDSGSAHFGVESFVHPAAVYVYDRDEGHLHASTITRHQNHDDYVLERVFFHSADGTRCPMTIMSRRGMRRNGDAQVLLYGYGGWGIPWLPRYTPEIPLWLELGGIYALANLRGGMEYGESWHQAGQFMNKQNVFDDFCAAAKYLVSEGYTRPERIAIKGASNGGLLTAACYNQHPELFGAVISQVAAIDLMRLWNTAVGGTQVMELGSPAESREMAEYLLSYSPMQNVRHQGPFPPILNVVGEADPRCKPGHIYKYVAELQRMNDPDRIAMLSVIWGAGHGGNDRATITRMTAEAVAWAWHMTS